MPQTGELKRARMHLRVDSRTKRKLERAAAYSLKSTTDFVLENAIEAAERVIHDHEKKVVLSEADWDVFYDALVKPPKPTRALRSAFRRYQKLTS